MARYKVDPYLFKENEKVILKAVRTLETPLKISRSTGIPRPTVYVVLEKLKTRGLVKREILENKTVWLLRSHDDVESPNTNKHIDQPNKILKIHNSKESINDFLEKLVENDPVRFKAINGDYNPGAWQKYVGGKKAAELNKTINKNNIVTEVISSKVFIEENMKFLGQQWAESFKNKPTEYHLIDPRYTNYSSQIFIKGGKVFIINIDKLLVIEIKDADIYKCFESIFEFMKDHSKTESLSGLINEYKKTPRT